MTATVPQATNTFDELLQQRDDIPPGGFRPTEVFWRDHQQWLEQKGYMLRPRYHPGWVPSWEKQRSKKSPYSFEDAQESLNADLLDAIRMSDNEVVMLKKVSVERHPYEVEIGRSFSSEPLVSHPKNHCASLLDVLQVPDDSDKVILVMPLLANYDSPRFKTIGEAVEFFRQIIEGLQFMHQCNVAHCDGNGRNIMMDPKRIFPKLYHPSSPTRNRDLTGPAKHHTRTKRPPKYYLIDFGLSRKYEHRREPIEEQLIIGGDKSAPEFRDLSKRWDPFKLDIYYLGNMIREDFLQLTRGLEFMQPLVADMVQDDPSKRPDIDVIAERFSEILQSLSWWKLRSRLIYEKDTQYVINHYVTQPIGHFFRTAAHMLAFRSALPRPR
ncbi:hypothetical protein K474DRAFT_1768164 [Panus rudis PR-1116 ss-1]|nr:hypothetical protein K474DRAFT_1768164 [Panus rudis PR-1116 ss-1]